MPKNTFKIRSRSGNYVIAQGMQEVFSLEKSNHLGIPLSVTERYAWYVHPIEKGVSPPKTADKFPNADLVQAFTGKPGKYEIGCYLQDGKKIATAVVQVIDAKSINDLLPLPMSTPGFIVKGDIKIAYALLNLWKSSARALTGTSSTIESKTTDLNKFIRGINKVLIEATSDQADSAKSKTFKLIAQLELDAPPRTFDLCILALCSEKKHWSIVDWSSFGEFGTSSVFRGAEGLSGFDSLSSALENWEKNSKYPPGIVRYSCIALDGIYRKEISGVFPSQTPQSYVKSEETIQNDIASRIKELEKFSAYLDGLETWMTGCEYILDHIGSTSGSSGNNGHIKISHPPTTPRPLAKINTTHHQAIYLALSVLGSSYKTDFTSKDPIIWKRGGQVTGANPVSPTTPMRFIGEIQNDTGIQGILCPESIAKLIEERSAIPDPFQRIKDVVDVIARGILNQEVTYVDAAWTDQNHKFLSELKNPDSTLALSRTDIQSTNSKHAKHVTRIEVSSEACEITRHYPFDQVANTGKKIALKFDRYSIKGLFSSKYPATIDATSKLFGIDGDDEAESIPDTRFLYVFQSDSESSAKLIFPLPPFNPSNRTIEIDTSMDLIAFISPVKLNSERLSFYSSNRDHLISRGYWLTSSVLNSYPEDFAIHLVDHDHSIKSLLDSLNTLDKNGELLNQSERIKLSYLAEIFSKVNPDFCENLNDDFPELLRFQSEWVKESSLVEQARSFSLDLLFDLKRNTQWALLTEDLLISFNQQHDDLFEYLGLMTHDNEIEYLSCQNYLGPEIDPLGTTTKIRDAVTISKAAVGFAKSSKVHTFIRQQTIGRMLNGILPFELDTKIISKRAGSFPLASRQAIIKQFRAVDFNLASEKFIANLEKILTKAKDLEQLFDKNRKAWIISSISLSQSLSADGNPSITENTTQRLSKTGQEGLPRQITTRIDSKQKKVTLDVVDEIAANAKFAKVYAAIKASEPALLHVGLAIDIANLYLTSAKAHKSYSNNTLSKKDATAVVADALSVAKGALAISTYIAQHTPNSEILMIGRKTIEKRVGFVAAIASTAKSCYGIQAASRQPDDQLYFYAVAESGAAMVGATVAIADLLALTSSTELASFGGLYGVIAVLAINVALYKYRDATEVSLKNWPGKAIEKFKTEYTSFDCVLSTTSTANEISPLKKIYLRETPSDTSLIDSETLHLCELFTQTKFSLTEDTTTSFGTDACLEFSTSGFFESTRILFGNFSSDNKSLERFISDALGISTPSCLHGEPEILELRPSDFTDGVFSRRLQCAEIRNTSYKYTLQIDLFGDGKFMIPAQPRVISGETILKISDA